LDKDPNADVTNEDNNGNNLTNGNNIYWGWIDGRNPFVLGTRFGVSSLKTKKL
jgi:hypothetical protein